MWDLIVSVPDHCLSFYFEILENSTLPIIIFQWISNAPFSSLFPVGMLFLVLHEELVHLIVSIVHVHVLFSPTVT